MPAMLKKLAQAFFAMLFLSLAAMAPARAAVIVGTFDPGFGGAFTNLGWRGSITLQVPDYCFTSALKRAQHTLDLMLEEMGIVNMTITRNQALNERDYGDLAGLNKDDARKKWGEEQVLIWRRSYDVPPPGGESLKDTAARTLPYYHAEIEPMVLAGKTVLVAAHGNSLRSMVMAIEKLTPEQILKRELATGEPVIYQLAADGALEETLAA